jgi:hypothetical protein
MALENLRTIVITAIRMLLVNPRLGPLLFLVWVTVTVLSTQAVYHTRTFGQGLLIRPNRIRVVLDSGAGGGWSLRLVVPRCFAQHQLSEPPCLALVVSGNLSGCPS